MDEAVCCRLLAVCSVRAERSWLPVAISALAVWMPWLVSRTSVTSLRSASCITLSDWVRSASSSLPLTVICRFRSPAAMAWAMLRASSIGATMDCELARVVGTTISTTIASTPQKA